MMKIGYAMFGIFVLAALNCQASQAFLEDKQQLAAYQDLERQISALDPVTDYDKKVRLAANAAGAVRSNFGESIKRKHHALATRTFDELIKKQPARGGAYFERAYFDVGPSLVGFKMSVPKRNLEDIDRAVHLEPENAEFWHRRYSLYLMNMNAKEAALSYERAIEFAPKTGAKFEGHSLNQSRFELAKVYLIALRDEASAVRHVEDAYREGISQEEYHSLLDLYIYFDANGLRGMDDVWAKMLTNPSFKKFFEENQASWSSEWARAQAVEDYKRMRLFGGE